MSEHVQRRTFLKGSVAAGAGALFVTGLVEAVPGIIGDHVEQVGATPTNPSAICYDPTTLDTFSAVAAFVIPGDDKFSIAQGVSRTGPGAVAAGAPQTITMALNQILLDPTMLARLVDAINGLLGPAPQQAVGQVCAPIGSAIPQSGPVALAPAVALILNSLAVLVQPNSRSGQFQSTFARLSWADKAKVWSRFETDVPAALAPNPVLLDVPVIGALANFAESLSGLLDYASGAVLELVGLLTYTEGLAYDRSSGKLTGTPIGWQLTSYQLDASASVDGWDEFKGYYQGRTSINA